MKRILLVLSLFFAIGVSAAVPNDAEIRKLLAERLQKQQSDVAIVVGVIEPRGRRVISHGNVNGDTLFEIGSVTKVFTALLLADSVQRGEVALTDPVSKYLPAEVKVPAVTLEQLARHTSGLPRLPANLAPKDAANPYVDYTVAQLYEFLSAYELPRAAGSQYEYSNLGAGLLGHALAQRAGVDYATLVRTRITAPLGMKSTTVTLTDALRRRLAPGHGEKGERVANWDVTSLAGAGALRSTANDLLTFVAAHLGYQRTPLAPAMTLLLASRSPAGAPDLEIALGWHVLKTHDGREIAWHNGGTGGYRSFVGFDPKTRSGVVLLTNSSSGSTVDELGRRLLDAEKPTPKEVALDPAVLDRYVGRYELAPNFILTVTREDNQLVTQATGQPKFPIFASSETEFFVKAFDAKLTFGKDSVVLHQGGRDMAAKRLEGEPPPPKVRKEITVAPTTLDRYVGRYQLAPTFIITITREGDSLFLQATAQPKFPLFAESEREFFLKVVDAQVTFEDGALILHQNGMDQRAKKLE